MEVIKLTNMKMSRTLHEYHIEIAYSYQHQTKMSKLKCHLKGPYTVVDVRSNGTVTIKMDMYMNASTFKEYRNTE